MPPAQPTSPSQAGNMIKAMVTWTPPLPRAPFRRHFHPRLRRVQPLAAHTHPESEEIREVGPLNCNVLFSLWEAEGVLVEE